MSIPRLAASWVVMPYYVAGQRTAWTASVITLSNTVKGLVVDAVEEDLRSMELHLTHPTLRSVQCPATRLAITTTTLAGPPTRRDVYSGLEDS